MFFSLIVKDYFKWHYTQAFHEVLHVWHNLLWFIVHFFSIPQLTRALFAPFKRITESKARTFSFEAIASYIIINTLSRLIGACARGIVICLGLVAVCICFLLGLIVFLLWAFAPMLIVTSLGIGISLIVTNLPL